jgi:NAD(P)-dependent dehydrogenase (short-subunit alcohol dehydrogenase family)
VKLLIVGAREGSIGHTLKAQAQLKGYEVTTAGLKEEDIPMNLVDDSDQSLHSVLCAVKPQHVICTAGINASYSMDYADLSAYYEEHFAVNVIGPMRLLEMWQHLLQASGQRVGPHHYVAISSNSARVPRTGSAAYCASKAALSQALRVKAREMQGGDLCGLVVYGYEPGLIEGTPMTAQTARDYPGVPLTRMRGSTLAQGISRFAIARMVVAGLDTGAALNGVLVPFDAGEC